jgi:hypothetical protein
VIPSAEKSGLSNNVLPRQPSSHAGFAKTRVRQWLTLSVELLMSDELSI